MLSDSIEVVRGSVICSTSCVAGSSGLNTVHLNKSGDLIFGVKSIFGESGRGRLWDGNGEFRRLTMRGLIRPRLLSQRSLAATSNSWRYHFFRCAGGNGRSLWQAAAQ